MAKTIRNISLLTGIILGNLTLSHAAIIPSGTQLAVNQDIIRNNGSEPASLDVHKIENDVEFNIINDFFSGLVSTDRDGKLTPDLAARWETKDNKVWLFHLREGIKWSDGSPITAHDVVFSWRRLVDPQMASPYGSYIENMHIVNAKDILSGKKKTNELGVKALNNLTVEVTLEQPVSYFLQMLAYPIMVPISQKAVEKYGEKWTHPDVFVSSGPFKLAEWIVNEKVVGVRNQQYWDNVHTVINKVTYLPISSETADINRYLAGEIDITKSIPSILFKSLKAKLGDQVHITPALGVYYYDLNNQKAPFNDVRVRQALNLALDKTIIANKVLGQGQEPAYNHTPPNTGGMNLEQPDYASWTQQSRIEKAKQLLNEAGYNSNNPLKFNLLYNTSEEHKRIAIAATSMWKKNLGVDIVLQNQERKTMLDAIRQGNFDMVRYARIADYNNPASFLNNFVTHSSNNTFLYHNEIYDDLVRKAKATNDQKYFQRAENILAKDVPAIPVFYYVGARLVKPYIGGYYLSPLGFMSSKDLYVIKH
ncbi:ABC transporter substrate-binding protein [Photorhabdus heterorhabditis]|uniref:Peptide ABC transporter substrate-binding protein n=1 Tax=Photorhabdus heterorhabditis TaxID=880156 RepID=A0ABR5KEV1_9GAMM|nr:ABC transporter substrate-binding protein [Photorhabdus heterorhabditis]KOY63139.1 peptide ABC transporter substrate-binding protein [Photorhabdus heterorhabditis]MBS9441689.1 oligopeptide ABC transporter substrate-binding protein OppA [Photorhabdus heterorhabditis]